MEAPSTSVSVSEERVASLELLGDELSRLRLCELRARGRVQQSLARHGQLGALTVWRAADAQLQVVDGFKRLSAARELGWSELRIREFRGEGAEAKVAIALLNEGGGLSELEEAWLVRALYREEHLPQPRIGQLLGRDKSWVSRRLALAEGLEEAVVAYVRLGLLSARAAAEISRLSRDNQCEVAERAMRCGLTSAQVGWLVGALLACADAESRARLLSEEQAGPWPKARRSSRRRRTVLEEVVAEVATLRRSSVRLQSQILEPSLWTLSEQAGALVRGALGELGPVLEALGRTVERALAEHRNEAVMQRSSDAKMA